MKNFIKSLLGFQWLCLLCLGVGAMPAFAQAPTNGLVAYYPFNGNANDASGNGNNGVVNGATLTTDRFGNANKAYNFDGNNAIITSLTQSNVTEYTISCWLNVTNMVNCPVVSAANADNTARNIAFHFWQGYLFLGLSSNDLAIGLFTTIPAQQWVHITGVFTSTAGTVVSTSQFKIYINGALATTLDNPYNPNGHNYQAPFSSETGNMKYGNLFQGKLDDIRIYNRALSQTEVTQLYVAENSRLVCTNPVGQPTHTASFNYDISTGAASMRFGDGQTAALTGSSGTITHTYLRTGIFYAELLKDNVPVDTVAVTVKTCGWMSKVNSYNENAYVSSSLCNTVNNGIWHIPSNPFSGEYWSYANRFQDYNISGDNASFEVRAKNADNVWCRTLGLVMYGKKSSAVISFVDICGYWAGVEAGKTHNHQFNVNELVRETSEYHVFKLKTENHSVKVFYDSLIIYSMPYEGELGDLIGVSAGWYGLGSLDWAEVRANGAATPAFREDFTTCDEATATRQTRMIQYGDSFVFNGHTYRTSGTYRDTLSCDNIVITNLTVLSCQSQITSDAFSNQLTCLTPSTLLTPSITTGGVAPYTYRWDNGATDSTRRVHRSGTYRVTITDANGCLSSSSIAITSESNRIELGFLPDTMPILTCYNQSVRIQIPDSTLLRLNEFSYRVWFNGNLWVQGNAPAYPSNRVFNVDAVLAGTYDFELTPMATGCTITGRIQIRDERNRLNVNDFRITAPTTTLTCATTTIPLTVVGANGNPLTGYNYAWTSTDFVGQASNIRNITTSGRDSVWVINTATNCRSLLPQTIEIQRNIVPPTIQITASNPTFTCGVNNIALTASGGATYIWNDNTTANPKNIQNTGTYTVTGMGANGCQNTANVVIGQTAGMIRGAQVNQTICQGSSLTVGNQTFTTAGDYTVLKTGRLGCDTTYTLHLTVEDSTYRQAISIAAGTSYRIGSSTYSASGTYKDTFFSANRCLRMVTTVLTVLPAGVALDTNYRMPNVVLPCQATTFCVDITKNNIVSDIRGWQGIVSYPSNCLQYTSGFKGTAIASGFSDFWVDAAAGQVHFAITPAVGTPIASNGTIAQVCFQLRNNANCAAPYTITVSPIQETYADNARNRFVTVGSSRVTTTTNDTVRVTTVYCGNTLQPFGNVAGAGNARTEIKSCNPNVTGVMLPNPQGEAICKAGDTVQFVRNPNADAMIRLSVVNSMDAYRIIQFANHNSITTPTDGMHQLAADVDGNGEVLANDAYAALRISVGLDPVKYIWLPTAQVPMTNLNSTIVPIVSNCIPMPSVACAPQAMQIQTIQRGDFIAQAITNDGKLAPLRQEIWMDLTRTYRIGDTIVIPIGYESTAAVNAVDLDITTPNNRLRFAQVEAKPASGFDQFLSNPTNNMVRNSGFGNNINGICFLQLKMIVPNGVTLQASDFTATRSLLNGVDASLGFRTTTTTCVTGIPDPVGAAKIGLFPNPTSQQLTIDYNQAVKQLSIVNLLGQSLKTLEINASGRMDVDVSELPQGVYFLRINEKEMMKFVKM